LDDEGTTQFTDTPLGISDFAVSYDGAIIVYAALNEDGGSYLGLLDLVSGEDTVVFQCPDGYRCQQPKLSPNLEEVAFEQVILEEGPTGKKILGPSEIWKIRLENTSHAFRLSAAEHNAASPLWSPKGLLAYFDFSTKEIIIVEPLILPDPSVQGSIVSELGVVGVWTLDGTSLIFPDMIILDDTYARHETTGDEFPLFYSHLFRQSINFELREDLSSMEFDLVEDASPALSPDGVWIAFTRKFLQQNLWTPGRQIWVMRTDGSQATQITDAPDFNHSSLSWRPDGSAITFVRTNQNDFAAGPEVWFYEFETGEIELLSRGAHSPQWIP
jgi:Tol biopolymer transport system component